MCSWGISTPKKYKVAIFDIRTQFSTNDSDFGDVECVLKRHTNMFSPEDYIRVMKSCRKKRPIEVVSIEKKDFVSTKKLEKVITNRKKSCEEEKINWLKIKEIKVLKEKPFSIFIKTHDAN
ncbi:unnamed protein product [Acanthoscelides obtectus]|uniref:Uncharacterized protein n=1 Tax=Acanthoscelides obtectus TaxID=200917 RepID=A0A9P0K4W7_ACAOB|nr:unnamed protein product [Acanthoscelides obtectus]CAK1668869.1 hypothetical protein AOBTE_LOCUS26650 [Acanthoscelides obtectus]